MSTDAYPLSRTQSAVVLQSISALPLARTRSVPDVSHYRPSWPLFYTHRDYRPCYPNIYPQSVYRYYPHYWYDRYYYYEPSYSHVTNLFPSRRSYYLGDTSPSANYSYSYPYSYSNYYKSYLYNWPYYYRRYQYDPYYFYAYGAPSQKPYYRSHLWTST